MPDSPEVMLSEVMDRYLSRCCVCFRGATRQLKGLVIMEDVPDFCDRHGVDDIPQYCMMKSDEYEELPQAELVRRYEALHRCQGPLPECAWHGAVEGFVEAVNARFCASQDPKPESIWVRVRPPSEEELGIQVHYPKMMPFLRVGSLAHVLSCYSGGPQTRYVEIRVGSSPAVYTLEDFMKTYIKTVDWTPEQEGPLHD